MQNTPDNVQEAKDKASETAQEAKDKASETAQDVKDKASDVASDVKDKASDVKDKVSDTLQSAKDKISDTFKDAKDKLPEVTPTPPGLKAQTSANDLKTRLEWGEPALTIIDVRDRNTFNDGHIMGAMPMPMEELVDRVKSALEVSRDIYVYGETDEQTATAADQLRAAGFVQVAELKGGLPGWKAIGGPTEGISESRTPAGADDYNVVSRLKDQAE